MTRIRTLVVVLAGGAGGRLELLTRTRAKPAVPFAGTHRLIDFPLSNCHNAGLADVWVAQQFNPISLSDHVRSGAQVTMVTTEVDPDDAGRYGVVEVDGERVTDYAYKPDEPKTNLISNEVFVFTREPRGGRLERLDERDDLGDELLPGFAAAGEARASRFDGYWRDVGTVDAYHAAHMALLGDDPPLD